MQTILSARSDSQAGLPASRSSRRRRRRRRRWSGRAKGKLHRRRLLRARLRGEEWFWRKTERSRDKVRWETAHRHVVVLHCLVEVPALDGDSVLGPFQLRLQTEKILVRFQLWIALHHNEQTRQSVAQLALCSLEFLKLRRVCRRFVWIDLCLHAANTGPRIRYFDE